MIKGLVSTRVTKSYLSSLSRVWKWVYYQGIELSLRRTREQEMQTGLPRDRRRIKEAPRIPGSSSVPSAHVAVSGFCVCVWFSSCRAAFSAPPKKIPQGDPSARHQSSNQCQTKQFSGQITRWALISPCDRLLILTGGAYGK